MRKRIGSLFTAVALALTVLPLMAAFAPPASAVTCNQSEPTVIDITDPEATSQLQGGTRNVQVTVTRPDGADADTDPDPCENVAVDFEIMTGSANDDAGADPDADHQELITNAAGQVTFSYVGANSGRDNLRVWVEQVNDNVYNGESVVDTTTADFYTLANLALDTILVGPNATGDVVGAGVGQDVEVTHSVTSIAAEGSAPAGAPVAGVSTRLFNGTSAHSNTFANFGPNPCVTDATGTCSNGSITFNAAQSETFQGRIDGLGDDTTEGVGTDPADSVPGDCTPGSNTDGTFPEPDADDCVQVDVAVRTVGSVNAEPETNAPGTPLGTPQPITATVLDQFGQPFAGQTVSFEVLAGNPNDVDGDSLSTTDDTGRFSAFTCNTDAAGQCTVNFTPGVVGTDLICVFLDPNTANCSEPATLGGGAEDTDDDADVIQRITLAPTNVLIDCRPDANSPFSVNTVLAITCAAKDNTGADLAGINIDAEVTGANDPDGTNPLTSADLTCTTDATGECVLDNAAPGTGLNTAGGQPPNQAGATTIRAWVDLDGNDATVEADQAEGPNAATQAGSTAEIPVGGGGFVADGTNPPETNAGDNTDVVSATFAGAANGITISPVNDSVAQGNCNVYTATLQDAANRPISGVILDVQLAYQNFNATTNNGSPTFCTGAQVSQIDPTAPNPSNVTATAPANGVTAGETVARTDALGRVSFAIIQQTVPPAPGPMVLPATIFVTAYCDNTTPDANVPQQNPAGLCPTGDGDDIPDPTEVQQQATKTVNAGGTAAAQSVTVNPATDSNPKGTQHTVTVRVTNGANGGGDALNNIAVKARVISGPNTGTNLVCNNPAPPPGVTDLNGNILCTYTDTSANVGTDTIEAWVDQACGGTPNKDACEPAGTAQKTWENPPSGLSVNVTCDDTNGPSQNPRSDADTQVGPGDATVDCFNPLDLQTEVFTATVMNPNGTPATTDDTPVSGILVQFNIVQETQPDSFIVAGADPPNDGPFFCDTDINGQCSVTLTNPTPAHTETVSVRGAIFGQTAAGLGNNADDATKTWLRRGDPFSINLTPDSATNQTAQPPATSGHTVTALVTDIFRTPISGINVDFGITGRNAAASPLGVDKVTNASGIATFTYNDGGNPNANGTDNLSACADVVVENDVCAGAQPTNPNPNGQPIVELRDQAVKAWVVQLPVTNTVKLDMEMDDDGMPAGPLALTEDCPANIAAVGAANENGAGGFNENAVVPNPVSQPAQFVDNTHEICAVAFDQANAVILGGTITFTLTGPGHFTDRATHLQDLGQSVTVAVDAAGHAHTAVDSTVAGITTVTATKDGVSDSGNKTWVGQGARTVSCSPATGTNVPGDDHEITCVLEDNQGNPAPGAGLFATESGPGSIKQVGALSCDPINAGPDTCVYTADAQGLIRVVLENTTQDLGTQTVNFELATAAFPATPFVRVSNNPAVDECERPAGNPAGSPQGVCTQSATKDWVNALRNATIGVSPGTGTTGQTVTLTVNVTSDPPGGPVQDVTVRCTVVGANPGSLVAVTNASGNAIMTYSANQPGGDTITCFGDFNGDGLKQSSEPQVVGSRTTTGNPVDPGPGGALPGYTLVAADGGIFNFGTQFFGSLGNLRLNSPIVGMTYTPTGKGYFLVAADGGVFAFGDAVFRGSTGNLRLVSPVVGIAITPTGNGYWMVAADGGVFAFGDAKFFGSTGNIRLARPVVGMMRTISGNGYWLVASDGGVFAFGDAVFRGSTGNIRLNLPIVGATRTLTGNGYYLVASDGGVFAFGDAVFRGSTGNIRLNSPVVTIILTPSGDGYWMIASDGGVFAFNAPYRGSTGGLTINAPMVGGASPPPSPQSA